MSGLFFSGLVANIVYDFCLLYACYNLCVFLSFSLMIPVMSVMITNYEALHYVDFFPSNCCSFCDTFRFLCVCVCVCV